MLELSFYPVDLKIFSYNIYYRITPLVLLITCSSYLGVTAPQFARNRRKHHGSRIILDMLLCPRHNSLALCTSLFFSSYFSFVRLLVKFFLACFDFVCGLTNCPEDDVAITKVNAKLLPSSSMDIQVGGEVSVFMSRNPTC